MNDPTHGELPRHLDDARAHTEAGNYSEALSCLKDARGVQPENVYVLAFEKQIEQLLEMVRNGTVSDEHKSDILESIPHIIDRALAAGEGRKDAVPAGPSTAVAGQPAAAGRDDRAAALEWLKNQYFQHAHEYVQRGEYQHALTEIRRVFIIEPDNPTAHQLEQQILDLSQMRAEEEAGKSKGPAGVPLTGEILPPSESAATTAGSEAPGHRPGDDESPFELEAAIPQITGPEPIIEAKPAAADSKKTPAKKGFSWPAMAAIFASIIVIGGAIFFFAVRPTAPRGGFTQPPTIMHSPELVFEGELLAREQTFIISERGNPDGSPSLQLLRDTALAGTAEPVAPGPSGVTPPATQPASRPPSPRAGREPPRTTEQPAASRPAAGEAQRARQQSPPLTEAARTTLPEPSPSAAAPPRTTEFVPVQTEAQIVKLETPRLQEAVFFEGLEGQVVIQVKIDETGKPVETRILKSTNERLNVPVIDAVMRSKFTPARMTIGPVSSWLTIPFTLRKASR